MPLRRRELTEDEIEAELVRHEPLVQGVAERYRHAGVPMDDLMQYGRLGLFHAVLYWDASRGLQFSTYAVCCIMGKVRCGIREIRAAEMGCRPGEYWGLEKLRREGRPAPTLQMLSIEHRTREGLTVEGLIEDEAQTPEEWLFDAREAEAVWEMLLLLPANQRRVLVLTYCEELSAREIGRRLGLTGERVRQLRLQALRTLRAHCDAEPLEIASSGGIE